MSVLEVSHITKTFGSKHVLSDVNLTFEEGKIYGLLGRNGAGKSTLLSIMTNRIFAGEGEVKIDSENVDDNDAKLGLMYLMSEVNLYADGWKLKQIIKDSESFYGSFNHELADRLITEFGLDINQKFGKLSTGYNSIFKLILALCLPVKFVLLDEPVLGLDANHRELFYSELIQSYSDNPRTFIISTHLIEEVANIISDVIVLDQGRVILNQPVEDVLAKTHSVVGPEKDVDQYTQGLNVIGHDNMGSIRANYVYGDLDDRILPDTVQLSNFDLQKLFIYLTNQYEGSAHHEDK
ncbi:ABC transporter ATP-binding protein YtrB [Lentilactobacillus parabuchneri]|jgi:ABC-2 type transport system ATP-binding protein|uniref:ABC transporter ATP-binding protein YtrB n=2 Tax=Lentilactobacillus parabuchneri TaxID=152331 RepID=A0A1X1FHZ1_9LACO|nr:ABC transporter ATP-binding protein [Lentilactobacillus parabuchneri]APR06282.1 ABC transporter ATP-binding protein YtrB [Lentilactobacillus parabuchneri]KRM47635.1 ABC transporter-like protein [Lentilactobacillus parabuchneri DSM 5707 = NBRC 107865]KRN80344.1 ABC transporter-like protein [Lentilactobacillus parabuchneri]MBW0221708.1 ABC transporter ATP-binding protein [Lentilactobacillus parabuchneri]MBW0245067.1 ABC transporter ATP-binding protein [Lentilactobacillus parabuchneri]